VLIIAASTAFVALSGAQYCGYRSTTSCRGCRCDGSQRLSPARRPIGRAVHPVASPSRAPPRPGRAPAARNTRSATAPEPLTAGTPGTAPVAATRCCDAVRAPQWIVRPPLRHRVTHDLAGHRPVLTHLGWHQLRGEGRLPRVQMFTAADVTDARPRRWAPTTATPTRSRSERLQRRTERLCPGP
jgi:hypothetical protein